MYVCTRCNKKSEDFAQMSLYSAKACWVCGGSVYFQAKTEPVSLIEQEEIKKDKLDKLD